jgi:hypothetical protein
VEFWSHWFLPLLGAFLCVGGTYGVVQLIIDAYADNQIGELDLLPNEMCKYMADFDQDLLSVVPITLARHNAISY